MDLIQPSERTELATQAPTALAALSAELTEVTAVLKYSPVEHVQTLVINASRVLTELTQGPVQPVKLPPVPETVPE